MSEWKEYKFGDFVEINKKSLSKNFLFDQIEYLDTGSITRGNIDGYQKFKIDEAPSRAKRLVEKNDIIYSTVRPIQRHYGLLKNPKPNTVVSTGFVVISVHKQKADPYFIYYFLTQDEIVNYLDSIAEGSTSAYPSLTPDVITNMDIAAPDLPEQRAIAAILSSLDDKIDLLHRQNKTLEQLAETLFRQWFVEDKIWDGKLSEYIKIQGGYAFKSQDFREVGFAGVIKITNISMGSVDIINTQYVDEEVVKKIEEEKFRARRGDFLIAMTGAEIGKIGMIEQTNKQIWVNQRVGKLVEKVPFGNIVGYLALKSREGQEHIINTCSGSAQENISSSGIEEMDFMKYSPQIVEKFGLETKPLFEKILFNMAQIRTLTQLRDTLLPKLMSGEVRVSC